MRTFIFMALLTCAAADAVDDRLSAMSIKELRHLARNLGADDELPGRGHGVVEKSEVVAALAPVVRAEDARRRAKLRGRWIWNALYYGGLAAVLYVFAAPLLMATAEGRAAFRAEFDERRALATYAYQKGSPSAAVLVALTGVIDVATWYLRVSVLASWVAPRDSALRRWASPLPPVVVDPAAAFGETSGYGVNVAPMLAIWGLGFAKRRVGAAVGRKMRARAERRRDDRAARKKRH